VEAFWRERLRQRMSLLKFVDKGVCPFESTGTRCMGEA